MNELKIFEEANSLFATREYQKALFLFSQLSSKYKTNKEYELLAIICDIATEVEERGVFLFDYFMVTKNELGVDEAIVLVNNFISAYDGNNEKMVEILRMVTNQEVESLEAINYQDFSSLVQSRGSFKEAFEDIMFSTKVALNSKDEFFDFISQLIDNNFSNIAYSYLDGYNQMFQFDTKFQELIRKLEEKKLDNHIQ